MNVLYLSRELLGRNTDIHVIHIYIHQAFPYVHFMALIEQGFTRGQTFCYISKEYEWHLKQQL